jgi:hypothetical protein
MVRMFPPFVLVVVVLRFLLTLEEILFPSLLSGLRRLRAFRGARLRR